MRRLLRNRRALGAPVGNLIILMAAVVLSTTVVIFATNVTTSQVQKESLFIPESHVWYSNNTCSVAGLVICNTGPTDAVLSKIVVKGLNIQWHSLNNYVAYNNSAFAGDLPFNDTFGQSAAPTVIIGGQATTFVNATEAITLKAGETVAVYIAVPNRVMVYDLASSVRIVVQTTQAVYCTDTLVQTVGSS